jgi:hypothetical protein
MIEFVIVLEVAKIIVYLKRFKFKLKKSFLAFSVFPQAQSICHAYCDK